MPKWKSAQIEQLCWDVLISNLFFDIKKINFVEILFFINKTICSFYVIFSICVTVNRLYRTMVLQILLLGSFSTSPNANTNISSFGRLSIRLANGSHKSQFTVVRGRSWSSVTLVARNMATDVAEIRRQSPGYQYQSQWIHPDMSLEHPNTQNQPRTAARVTDGEIMNILWLLMMFIL